MPMLFQPSVTPTTLSNLGSVPLDMTLEGQNAVAQGQQADQMQMADLPGAYAHQAAMRPLTEQQQSLANQTTLANLPTIQANAQMNQLKAKQAFALSDSDIQTALAKNGAAATQSHADEMLAQGQMASDAAAAITANPVGGIPRAKEIMQKSGLWDSSWDTMDPTQLAATLKTYGNSVMDASARVRQVIAQSQYKAMLAQQLEAQKQQGRVQLRGMINSSLVGLKNMELQFAGAHDKPSMEQLAGRYTALANSLESSDDPQDQTKARELHAEAARVAQAAANMRAAGATVGNESRVDITGATGGAIPTVNPSRQSGTPAMPPKQEPTAPTKITTPQQAAQAGWILHVDKNGNKAYVSKDNKQFIEVK